MSTARSDPAPAQDFTAHARIRNAAITQFASEGFLKAKVRDIAALAGVSPALVIHHFGSKVGLREVCDAHVLAALLQRARDDGSPGGVGAGVRDYLANASEFHEQVRYMVRAINEDSPTADKFVAALVAESEGVIEAGVADGSMRASADLRATAVLNLLNSLALLSMPPAIARALGHESLDPSVMRRMTLPSLELYTYGLYTDDRILKSVLQALGEPIANRREEKGQQR